MRSDRPPRRHRRGLTAVLVIGAITTLAVGIVTAQGLLIGVGLVLAGVVGVGVQR